MFRNDGFASVINFDIVFLFLLELLFKITSGSGVNCSRVKNNTNNTGQKSSIIHRSLLYLETCLQVIHRMM